MTRFMRERGLRRLRRRCGAGRSTTSRASGRAIWDDFERRAARYDARARPTARCPAPSGSRARGSTTPSTSSRGKRRRRASRSSTRSELRDDRGDDLGRAARAGRARARRACARSASARATASSPTCRTSPRRSSRSWRPRRSARSGRAAAPEFGAAQRRRPLRADRAEGAARRRRLPLRRQGLRPPRDRRGPARGDADARAHRARCRTSAAARSRARSPGTSCSREREPLEFARVPFDHPLWVLYARGTTGLPKAIVHGHGGILLEHLKKMHLHLDAQRGRPRLLVHDDRLDDVELPRRRAAHRRDDPALRRQPGRATCCGTSRRETRHDVLRHERGVHRGVHEGGRRAARRRPRPRRGCAASARPARRWRPRASAGSTTTSATDTWLFSTSGGTDVCTAFVGGVPAAAGLRGRAAGAARSGAKVEAWDEDGHGRSSARSASSSSPSRCRRCRSSSGTTPTASATASRYFDDVPRRLAPRRLDRDHRARHRDHQRPLGLDDQPRRHPHGHERDLPRGARARRDRRRARRRPRRLHAAVRRAARGRELDDDLDQADRASAIREDCSPRHVPERGPRRSPRSRARCRARCSRCRSSGSSWATTAEKAASARLAGEPARRSTPSSSWPGNERGGAVAPRRPPLRWSARVRRALTVPGRLFAGRGPGGRPARG